VSHWLSWLLCCVCAQCSLETDFATFMHNDEQLRRAAHARWMLLCEREPTSKSADATSYAEAKGISSSEQPCRGGQQ